MTEEKIKIKATYEDNYSFIAGFPAQKAVEFLDILKTTLVGKPVNKLMVNDFWADYERLKDDNRDYYETAKHFYREHPGRDCLIWDWIIIFDIGGQHFEVSLWSPNRYVLGLNNIDVRTIIETKGKKISDFAEYMGDETLYFDVSCIFDKDVIGQKVKDIKIKSKKIPDMEDAVLDCVIIELENGKSIKISEDFDNVSVDIK